MILHFKCLAMNGTHNYHKNIKMYVLRCTTIGLKQEREHTTLRHADMNLRFKPHFTAKICQFFVPTSQKMRLCVDVIWRHSCSYVLLPIDMYSYPYREGYTNINQVIGIILLAPCPHHLECWTSHQAEQPPTVEIYRVGDNRRTVNTSTVRIFLISWGQKTCAKYCYVDLLSWYEIWFAVICIGMNIILDLYTATQQF